VEWSYSSGMLLLNYLSTPIFWYISALCTHIFSSNSVFTFIHLRYSWNDTWYSSVALGNEAIIGRVHKSTLTALPFQSWLPSPWWDSYIVYTAQEAPQKSSPKELLLLQKMPELSLKRWALFRIALADSERELEAA